MSDRPIWVILVSVVLILIFVLKKRQPLASFGLGWFLAGLAPRFYATLNVIAAEHQFYPASIGVYLVIAVLVYKPYMEHKRYFIYAASGLIGACAILSWFRNFEWKDGITLWKVEAKRSPSSAIVHNNLGYEYNFINNSFLRRLIIRHIILSLSRHCFF